MENKNEIRGFKVFNPDWTCRGFHFEVGQTYEEDVKPSCCNKGFHFCLKPADCFNYYAFDPDNKVAEVIALGDVDYSTNDTKACTNKLHIVREIPWEELLSIVNIGKNNTGLGNSGNWNSGNQNSGNWNSGNQNSGNRNTGDCNTGDWNSGNRNTGDCNTGNRNTGDWNTGDCNTGCFMTEEQKIMFFNNPSNQTYNDWLSSKARYLLNQIPKNVVKWISSKDMTDEEKEGHPTYETTVGYLKVLDGSECRQIWWDGLPECDKNIIKQIPNFDPAVFEECTGIKVS